MRKLFLLFFLTVSAALYLSAGTLSRTDGDLKPPVKGSIIPEVIKELPAPVLVEGSSAGHAHPEWKIPQGLNLVYIPNYGCILMLYGYGRVFSYTLTNLSTGQSQNSVVVPKHEVINGDLSIPVAEDGDYLLSFRTRHCIYEGYFTIDFSQLRQEQMNQFLGGF